MDKNIPKHMQELLARISDPELSVSNLFIMLYGQSGVGKTSQAATFDPEKYKVLILDLEKGVKSLVKKTKNVKVLTLNNIKETHDALTMIQKGMLDQFNVIILDSFVKLTDYLVDELNKKYIASDNGWDKWRDYDAIIRSIVNGLKKIDNKTIIMTSHEEQQVVDKVILKAPIFGPGSYTKNLQREFDMVIRMSVTDEGKRVLELGQSPIAVTKNRFDLGLPDKIYEGDKLYSIGKIVDYIREKAKQ